MVARTSHQFTSNWSRQNYFDLLDKTSMKSVSGGSLFRFRIRRKTVRSVQRMRLPDAMDAIFVKNEYLRWLEHFTAPIIQVCANESKIQLSVLFGKVTLLELIPSPERSNPDRQLMRISSGLLVDDGKRGRLEFRVVLNRRFVLVAIHDYKPTLPWFIYKYTQALVHLLVMRKFAKHLNT
jgi:hypothetical protein